MRVKLNLNRGENSKWSAKKLTHRLAQDVNMFIKKVLALVFDVYAIIVSLHW